MKNSLKANPFTLVLSGGGALGIAHLGVLHNMQKLQLMPQEIVGTSMGGIIGACMSIGLKEEEILEHIKSFTSVTKWIKFSLTGNAIVDNSKIESIFDSIFKDKKMKDTTVPLKLITTNLRSGRKRVFSAEDNIYIKDAVLATMAIPGVFDEHIIEGHHYGDGFLCENLGVNEASFHTVLAVDVLGGNSFEEEMPDNFFKTANVMQMFEKSMRFLIYNQTQTHLINSDKNIILLEPDTKEFNTFSFHKYKEIRALGLEFLN
ncbi:MAG: patatin-like phospholipase family protein [Epsilonproteobacteria bacterium]|nr:MAG: patatin-like phospholipase family protein [Campylobacterota bacterium]